MAMAENEAKQNFETILTRGRVTAAYFSSSGYVENKDLYPVEPQDMTENQIKPIKKEDNGEYKPINDEEFGEYKPINKEDSGVFMESSDEELEKEEKSMPLSTEADQNQCTIISATDQNQSTITSTTNQQLTEFTLLQSQIKLGQGVVIHKSDEKLSVISEKSCETDSYRTITSIQSSTRTVFITKLVKEPSGHNKPKTYPQQQTTKSKWSPEQNKIVSRKPTDKERPKKRLRRPPSPRKNINVDIPQVYQRQNTADLLHGKDEQIPVARATVNRKISNFRNKMYGNHLRESTKKLQDDLRQTMRKYSCEKTNLLKQLSSLRYEMGDMKLGSSSSSMTSEISSQRSNISQSRYYLAPNLAAHKIGKKKKKAQTKETKITISEENSNKSKEGILKLPTINSQIPQKNFVPKTPPKNIVWDSGRNNSMHNLPPLDPPPGIAAAQDLLHESFKIPKVLDATRHDITRLSTRSNSKKKVHFAEKHSVSEFIGQKDIMVPKNSWSGETKSLPPLSSNDSYSVDSIKAYSALPPIPWRNNDLDPDEVMRATQEYKSLYLKMKDPEQRMKTLAEILYSVRLRMIENEHTMKYGINPKHMKNANTLCDFLMNRNHNSSMSMNSINSELSVDMKGRSGIPHNTAARSGRKSNSLQLQNYLRKMSRNRHPSEDIRLTRLMGQQPAILETTEQSTRQTVTH